MPTLRLAYLQSKKNLPREQTVDQTTDEDIQEEALTRDTTTMTNACIVYAVQSVEKRAVWQEDRPNHRRRRHEEAMTDTTQ